MKQSEKEREILDSLEALFDAAEKLVDRVDELEASAMRYRGTWSGSAVTYGRGDCVTRSGVLWFCGAKETQAKPGDSSDWQMMHKSDS